MLSVPVHGWVGFTGSPGYPVGQFRLWSWGGISSAARRHRARIAAGGGSRVGPAVKIGAAGCMGFLRVSAWGTWQTSVAPRRRAICWGAPASPGGLCSVVKASPTSGAGHNGRRAFSPDWKGLPRAGFPFFLARPCRIQNAAPGGHQLCSFSAKVERGLIPAMLSVPRAPGHSGRLPGLGAVSGPQPGLPEAYDFIK